MILIVSSEADSHAKVILKRLAEGGQEATLLNLAQFPQQLQLSLNYNRTDHDHHILGGAEGDLALSACRVVWWRRPQHFELHSEITNDANRSFAFNESLEAFSGLWLTLNAFWINHPTRDQEAARKVYQLKVAQDVGLEIPTTLVTNNPEQARAFIDTHGIDGTIYKSFSATEQDWRETRMLKPEERDQLDSVKFAPVIFQKCVPAQADLRVTIMENHVFPAAIYSQETAYTVDCRMEIDAARVEPFEMPPKVIERLSALMRHLGLIYGAIDMRLTPDGRFVFLEINPSGQWLFIEKRTDQPITETFARLLTEHDRTGVTAEGVNESR